MIVHAKKTRQAQSGVGSDRMLAGDNSADAPLRYTDFLGQPILGNAHWLQKFLQQNFAGGRVGNFTHVSSLSDSPQIYKCQVRIVFPVR